MGFQKSRMKWAAATKSSCTFFIFQKDMDAQLKAAGLELAYTILYEHTHRVFLLIAT